MAVVILLLNIPFIIAGRLHVNHTSALKMLGCFVLLGLCLTVIP